MLDVLYVAPTKISLANFASIGSTRLFQRHIRHVTFLANGMGMDPEFRVVVYDEFQKLFKDAQAERGESIDEPELCASLFRRYQELTTGHILQAPLHPWDGNFGSLNQEDVKVLATGLS